MDNTDTQVYVRTDVRSISLITSQFDEYLPLLDKNKDDALSKEELTEEGADASAPLRAALALQYEFLQNLSKFDKDHKSNADGITKSDVVELLPLLKNLEGDSAAADLVSNNFNRIDQNSDGLLTTDELEQSKQILSSPQDIESINRAMMKFSDIETMTWNPFQSRGTITAGAVDSWNDESWRNTARSSDIKWAFETTNSQLSRTLSKFAAWFDANKKQIDEDGDGEIMLTELGNFNYNNPQREKDEISSDAFLEALIKSQRFSTLEVAKLTEMLALGEAGTSVSAVTTVYSNDWFDWNTLQFAPQTTMVKRAAHLREMLKEAYLNLSDIGVDSPPNRSLISSGG